jgi:hypothetical protein
MTCTPSPEKKSEAEKADSENSQKLSRNAMPHFPLLRVVNCNF